MTATGLEVFDTTLHKTNEWLKRLGEATGWERDRQACYALLRAVMHTLRDRLTVEENAHLAAQLPLLLRGVWYEGWHPADKPLKYRQREAFLERVRERAARPPEDVDERVPAVLRLIGEMVTPGEAAKVRHELPSQLRALWPEPGDRR